ncbi:hypothetical protein L596_008486 [Steinernema carpocapsae]|uniref:Uncharacterized protein n=1 Tax=Steinernema carpocapsae TaxID=34508 RepID=A0A4U5PCQ6_STECR|nr:hypothetical protein L596_008486 [Steinernema carpocapsae]
MRLGSFVIIWFTILAVSSAIRCYKGTVRNGTLVHSMPRSINCRGVYYCYQRTVFRRGGLGFDDIELSCDHERCIMSGLVMDLRPDGSEKYVSCCRSDFCNGPRPWRKI